MSWTEICAAFLSALGVWLTSKRSILCWPVSFCAAVLYGGIFFNIHLYADTLLQIIFCILIMYGWYNWKEEKNTHLLIHVKSISLSSFIYGNITTLIIGAFWSAYLASYTDDPTPVTDALLSSYSITAQLWAAKRYTINWLAWILIDTAYSILFFSRNLYITSLLYACFVLLACVGYKKWQRAKASSLY
ncbi:nicotinamide riboside transporter PnuC [Swingsia samuiensis]|uniref:Nicotinamide riboside transporter PnuC n=1 Tax=Swingsia samuiensis TaxID=1293412 RepID=A0A4Y6UK11_9PROT|nr:nicotinamide riboside transporter PnuC [Swingsia samuiensis]QDH17140.1 nicotinamide riboside transporter PnuC [Swingsia samuiensis]